MPSPLRSGERQVGETLDKILSDHVARYEFAAKSCEARTVVDVGCGCGYGSAVLAASAKFVWGIDHSDEAIEYALKHWQRENIMFGCFDVERLMPEGMGPEVAVAFEIVEHLKRPEKMLKALKAKTLLCSVPNGKKYPTPWTFHERHYTPEQLDTLLRDCGWNVRFWHHQIGRGPVMPNIEEGQARTLIAVAHR